MMKRWILVSGLTGLAAAVVMAATTAQPGAKGSTEGGPPPGYALAPSFDEEFAGQKPSQDWGNVYADPNTGPFPITKRTLWGNAEREVYFDKDYLKLGIDPFTMHDGMMTVTAAPMDDTAKAAVLADLDKIPQFRGNPALRNLAYSSGLITQRGRFVQQYGYFEARMRWTKGTGIWPAFWLLRQDSHWPPEIDIMEAIGKKPYEVYSSTHSNTNPHDRSIVVPMEGRSPQDFHRYGALWLPDRIDYYVDGVKTTTLPTTPDMNQPMYMILNLAIGGHWPGDPDAATPMPAKMDIDYVRAWKFVGTPPGTAP
jgi:beta-glucanase (GH16 family)